MKSRRELYSEQSPAPWDHFGSSGDGLLFACLLSIGRGKEFAIEEAMNLETGQLFRNPILKQSGGMALRAGESTISRDMLTGFLLYCLHFSRLDLLNLCLSYAVRHLGKMGQERKVHTFTKFGLTFKIKDNRTWLTPGLFILMLAIRAHLRGNRLLSKILISLPQIYATAPGYVSHLTMLHLVANRTIRGYLISSERSVLRDIATHSPSNALLHALREDRVAFGLVTSKWPIDRLPDTHDWKEEWRTQRADGDSNLLADTNSDPDSIRVHSGGDLLFSEAVMDGDI